MGNDFIEATILEGFNLEETEQDKRYYLDDLRNFLGELYTELNEAEEENGK